MTEDKLIEDRIKKIFNFFKQSQIWVFVLLIIAVVLGVYIRSLPMQDHNTSQPGTQPGLWDYTTNDWTLGPDLDPWLFTRYGKTIVTSGELPRMDYMRYPPLGYDTYMETRLLSYMIAWTHYFSNSLFGTSYMFAAVVFPVVMFIFIIIAFFFFVREIFIREDKESKLKANAIAIISTYFLIVIPSFLSRTVAGIPEKESAGFFFMFFSLYLFLFSWKNKNNYKSYLISLLSGFVTALMGLIWGGLIYVFVSIGVASLIYFVLVDIKRKESINYFIWFTSSIFFLVTLTDRYSLNSILFSTRFILSGVTFFVLFVHFLLNFTPLSKKNFFDNWKIPKSWVSIIVSVLAGIILISIVLGPSFILDKGKDFVLTFISPSLGRWGLTVAENRQPYFTEWGNDFGPFIKGIPVIFWLFFSGSILLFFNILKDIRRKEAWILTSMYILFFFGLVFSRYAPHPNLLDGEGTISLIFYFGSAALLIISFLLFYYKDFKEKKNSYSHINYEYIFLFAIFVLCLFTARSAIRLIMVLAPIAQILVSYLIIELYSGYKKSKDELSRVIYGVLVLISLILIVFSFWTYYQSIISQSYNFVPSYYNVQWQNAMDWVRTNTSEKVVFAHWWDYGYWLQSIGERATVLDGGNNYAYWNYLMGRHVLTGDNQNTSLEYLYNHNATHLLIDSSDIGKYGAFSSIGSDKNYDRYSWIGTYLLDEKQTYETNNETYLIYSGGIATDEDLIINESGKEVFLPGKASAAVFMIVPYKTENMTQVFSQPLVVIYYKNVQHKTNLRYLYVNGKFIDFKTGVPGCVYVFPRILRENNRVGANPIGASMYLSPRLMRGYLTQKYILNDSFNKFPNFKLVHSEPNVIVSNLNDQGMNLPEFIYFDGIQGPIKIWEIRYSGEEKYKYEYVDTDASKYLDWGL